ncbi:2'-5' RNA ligase family protein [Gordonia sp. TBRC 11910]|uniref:2'-5' RNA ligase family protein n=1 Tax=Gordonia asplenii TaxID=2725283 RepID=A0A848L2K0_9ACTN|nr:2'-5' RNA ligase family protein [Gordonia asplenii]NMO04996.1 2'-5' RNA ligase family protein [Gordonia asplenii]
MTHSIELLPDPAADRLIRDQWSALDDAGIPNRGSLQAETNRPHATLLAAPSIDVSALSALTPLAMRLPVSCGLGALIVFDAGERHTLARLVVPSSELLSIHATVVRLSAPMLSDDPAFAHSSPGNWTPHITLARRLTTAQVGAALDVLGPAGSRVTFTALRQWDGDTATENILRGRDC